MEKEKREEFYGFFKEVETLYEILSPSPGLRDYVENFSQLSTLYQVVRNAFRKKTAIYGDIARKTAKLVRERVGTEGLYGTTKTVTLNENTLKAIKDSSSSDTSKVINLINTIGSTVEDEGANSPYLKSIGERAEAIRDLYDDRQCTTQDALRKIEELLTEYIEARRQEKESGLDINAFTIFWTLKQEGAVEPKKHAPVLDGLFVRFPNYRENVSELRQLKAELYKILLGIVGKENMVRIANRLLQLDRK